MRSLTYVLVAAASVFLTAVIIAATKPPPPPTRVVVNPPEPVEIEDCIEQARACYAKKRSSKVKRREM